MYHECLDRALRQDGLDVAREVVVPVRFDGDELDAHYRMDPVVEDAVALELKATEDVLPVHEAQLLTYLRMGDLPLGLLLNFHVARLLDGVTRVINPDR